MNRIDELCTALIREGRITLTEALAIGASVRFITTLDHTARQEFVCRYGTEARDNCFNLLQSPIKGDNHMTAEQVRQAHAAKILQQQMDGI